MSHDRRTLPFGRRVVAVLVAGGLAATALVAPRPATATHASPKVVVARNFVYEPTPTTVAVGDHLDFTNQDAAPHDVVARATKADGSPVFASAVVTKGQTAPVLGVESLAPGSFAFYCSIHPTMAGTLVVGADPVPAPPVEPPKAALVATVPAPTSITSFNGRLYVASYTGTVFEMDLLAGGVPGPARAYITGVSSPLGVVIAPDGTTFVADSHPSATPGRTTAGRVWAVPPGGGDVATVGQIVVDELPNGRHNTNGMAIRDGRLYITNGNSTDDGINGGDPEEPLSGTLLSVPLTARGIVVGQPSEAELVVEAEGTRNVYDVAFRPGTSEAWFPMNGLDAQDPWGEDLLLRTDVVQPAADFGFPGCVYAEGFSPNYRQNLNPEVTDVCDGRQKMPEQLMGLHTSADGLAFGPEVSYWDGDLFVALFGNFFGSEVVGHRVVRVPIDGSGASSPPQDVFLGGTPLDLTFVGTDMYVADFAAGVLLVKPAG